MSVTQTLRVPLLVTIIQMIILIRFELLYYKNHLIIIIYSIYVLLLLKFRTVILYFLNWQNKYSGSPFLCGFESKMKLICFGISFFIIKTLETGKHFRRKIKAFAIKYYQKCLSFSKELHYGYCVREILLRRYSIRDL